MTIEELKNTLESISREYGSDMEVYVRSEGASKIWNVYRTVNLDGNDILLIEGS